MKSLLPTLCAACALAFALQNGAVAADSEYTSSQNVPPPKQGTSEERSAERKTQRAETKSQAKAGEIPQAGDDLGMNKNKPAPVAGTHETRSAERKTKQGELKQVIKAGDMPVTNEAGVDVVKKNP